MPKILIVEDNEMNRDMISRRLERKGFAIVMAGDGAEGIAMAHTEKPDLILMDLSLPKVDGWEASRRLKADPRTRAMPIIALTAHAMAGDKEKALEAGADDYDTKPVDFPRLIGKIEHWLKISAAARAGDQPAPARPSAAPPTADRPAASPRPAVSPGVASNAAAQPAKAPAPLTPLPTPPVRLAGDGVSSSAPAGASAAGPARLAPAVALVPPPARSPDPVGEKTIVPAADDHRAALAATLDAETDLAEADALDPRRQMEIPIPIRGVSQEYRDRHLLIVDDNENNRDMLARRFEKQGYRVECAAGGEDALEMLTLKKFDVVLLDIMMPVMDGIEVLKRLRKKFSMVELPVIMVTAKGDRDALINALDLGANDFIPKPVDFLVAHARTRTQLRLKQENERSEKLLTNILPKLVADLLKSDAEHIAQRYPEATVMFSDIVGFTELSGGLEAKVVVRLLNEIFSAFDDLAERYGLEKIKTMGDGYMVVGGVPQRRADHAHAIADMALEMQRFIVRFNRRLHQPLGLRIGVATGPVVAGVIGKSKFAYDLWGDTVNVASRMESHGQTDRIQVARPTYDLLEGNYSFEPRGTLEVKGKGQMETFFLLGKKD